MKYNLQQQKQYISSSVVQRPFQLDSLLQLRGVARTQTAEAREEKINLWSDLTPSLISTEIELIHRKTLGPW